MKYIVDYTIDKLDKKGNVVDYKPSNENYEYDNLADAMKKAKELRDDFIVREDITIFVTIFDDGRYIDHIAL